MGQKDLSSILKGITNININSFEFLKKQEKEDSEKYGKLDILKKTKSWH